MNLCFVCKECHEDCPTSENPICGQSFGTYRLAEHTQQLPDIGNINPGFREHKYYGIGYPP